MTSLVCEPQAELDSEHRVLKQALSSCQLLQEESATLKVLGLCGD